MIGGSGGGYDDGGSWGWGVAMKRHMAVYSGEGCGWVCRAREGDVGGEGSLLGLVEGSDSVSGVVKLELLVAREASPLYEEHDPEHSSSGLRNPDRSVEAGRA
jgi:hypothetical protein